MIETVRVTSRRYGSGGPPDLVVVEGAFGGVHVIVPTPVMDLSKAIADAVVNVDMAGAANVEGGAWLRAMASDHQVTGTALRAATLLAGNQPGQWIGLASMANRLHLEKSNLQKAIRLLRERGFLEVTHEAGRAFYRRVLP